MYEGRLYVVTPCYEGRDVSMHENVKVYFKVCGVRLNGKFNGAIIAKDPDGFFRYVVADVYEMETDVKMRKA